MKKQTTLPALFITAVALSACSSNTEVHTQKQTSKQYQLELAKQVALAKQREQQNYQLYTSDCVTGLSELSWTTEVFRGELMEKVYQQCMEQFRAGMNEEEFHKAVIQQLPASRLWFDSALWLQQKGEFAPLLQKLCVAKADSKNKILYLPRLRYPIPAARDGVEGKVEASVRFDANGFFKEVIELKGTPERIFDRETKRLLEKTVACASGEELEQSLTINFTLDDTPS